MLNQILRNCSNGLRYINNILCQFADACLYLLLLSVILYDYAGHYMSAINIISAALCNFSMIYFMVIVSTFFICQWIDEYLLSVYDQCPDHFNVFHVVSAQSLNNDHELKQEKSDLDKLVGMMNLSSIHGVDGVIDYLKELSLTGHFENQSEEFIVAFVEFHHQYMDDGDFKFIKQLHLNESSCPITFSDFPSDPIIVTSKSSSSQSDTTVSCRYLVSQAALSRWATSHDTCPLTRLNLSKNSSFSTADYHKSYHDVISKHLGCQPRPTVNPVSDMCDKKKNLCMDLCNNSVCRL